VFLQLSEFSQNTIGAVAALGTGAKVPAILGVSKTLAPPVPPVLEPGNPAGLFCLFNN